MSCLRSINLRAFVFAIVTTLALGFFTATATASLRIVIIEGEDAVNIIQQKTAVAPVVEVRDRNDQPVATVIQAFSGALSGDVISGTWSLSKRGVVTISATGELHTEGFPLTGAPVTLQKQ